jgi:pimeloyl-ACP methyl ester carboxylesterase
MTPFLLVPGLNCDARVYAGVANALWSFGPVTIANHQTGDSVAAIAKAILAEAPPKFGLIGFSMGGYIAFEILRRAPERVLKLALLDTSARPDSEESTTNRRRLIALAAERWRLPQGSISSASITRAFPGKVRSGFPVRKRDN